MNQYLATIILLFGFVLITEPRFPLHATPAADLTIYGDALASGWENWS